MLGDGELFGTGEIDPVLEGDVDKVGDGVIEGSGVDEDDALELGVGDIVCDWEMLGEGEVVGMGDVDPVPDGDVDRVVDGVIEGSGESEEDPLKTGVGDIACDWEILGEGDVVGVGEVDLVPDGDEEKVGDGVTEGSVEGEDDALKMGDGDTVCDWEILGDGVVVDMGQVDQRPMVT